MDDGCKIIIGLVKMCVNDQRDAQFLQSILFHNFCLLYMFQTNLVVHHQEQGIMYCITQFGTIVQASLATLKL